ncbi:4'-phosphopantetheinyl transferase family protein [Pseudoroseicyclus sp. H15]
MSYLIDQPECAVETTEAELDDALARLAPPWAAVAAVPIEHAEPLMDNESSYVVRAVASRRAEFAAGRTAARKALARLGHGPVAIPVGAHRAPVWPEGVIGSITHAAGWAAAIVGPAGRGRSLGLDIEVNGRVTEDIAFTIRAAGELPNPEEGKLLSPKGIETETLRFGAKEAVFKAFWPTNGSFLNFSDARVAFAPPRVTLGPGADPLHGERVLPFSYALCGGLVLTVVALG